MLHYSCTIQGKATRDLVVSLAHDKKYYFYLRRVEDCQSRASGPRLCLELGSWWDDRPHGWALQSCS